MGRSESKEPEMKFWCDLSWREKCKIKEGNVSKVDYLTGYSFDVKAKVREGKNSKRRARSQK